MLKIFSGANSKILNTEPVMISFVKVLTKIIIIYHFATVAGFRHARMHIIYIYIHAGNSTSITSYFTVSSLVWFNSIWQMFWVQVKSLYVVGLLAFKKHVTILTIMIPKVVNLTTVRLLKPWSKKAGQCSCRDKPLPDSHSAKIMMFRKTKKNNL